MVTFLTDHFFYKTFDISFTAQETYKPNEILRVIQDLDKIDSLDKRVVGGKATFKGEFPFLVSVQLAGIHSFTGSVITSRTVLTCGHCLRFLRIDPEIQKEYTIVIGIRNISKVSDT